MGSLDSSPSLALTPLERWRVPCGLARAHFRAMGSTISLLAPADDLKQAEALVKALFVEWEQTLSRFLPDSELSQLNRLAGQPVIVDELLLTVMSRALAAAQATDGWYDPTLLSQLVQAGYDRSFEDLPAVLPPACSPASPGGQWREIQFNHALRLVKIPAGVGVDLGGIAKGMAVDAALRRLHQEGIAPVLVNAGGDLAVQGIPVPEEHWPLEVQGKTQSWAIPLKRGALATSGVVHRHWKQGAHTRHHLLDPRTGLPARSGLWSVTVAATQCEQAEVAAKVAFLLGEARGRAFLEQHGLAGLLIREDNGWSTTGAWPKEMIRPYENTCI